MEETKERYLKNLGTISEVDQEKLGTFKVLVFGAGGLGGVVIEGLIRMGIKDIGLCEFDTFTESNLNRQLLAREDNIAKSKLEEAMKRAKVIDSQVNIKPYYKAYPSKEVYGDLKNYDIVVDCTDNIKTRKQIEKDALSFDKKVVFGAIGGLYGQFGVSHRYNKIFTDLEEEKEGIEQELGNPFYTPMIVGSFQVYLVIRTLLKQSFLERGFYYISLEDFEIETIRMY